MTIMVITIINDVNNNDDNNDDYDDDDGNGDYEASTVNTNDDELHVKVGCNIFHTPLTLIQRPGSEDSRVPSLKQLGLCKTDSAAQKPH